MEIKETVEKVKEKIKDFSKKIKESDDYANLANKIFDDEYHTVKEKIIDKIKEYQKIIIHRHVNPDGDAIGSSLGLRELIKTNFIGKEVYSVGDNLPNYLRFVGDEDRISDDKYQNALVIVVDTAQEKRIADERYKLAKEIIKIDHHVDVEDFSTGINYVRENYASCSLVIMDIFASYPLFSISKEAARYLYIATVTDTSRFRYKEVDAKALVLASKMLETGINTENIFSNLYSKDKEVFKLQGYFYKNIKYTRNGVSYMFMTKRIMKKFDVNVSEASNMVNLMDGIKGSMIWILFIERDKEIRVRLRSRFISIRDLAAKYNGGGHENASGATIYSKKQAKTLLNEADQILFNFKNKNKDKF